MIKTFFSAQILCFTKHISPADYLQLGSMALLIYVSVQIELKPISHHTGHTSKSLDCIETKHPSHWAGRGVTEACWSRHYHWYNLG